MSRPLDPASPSPLCLPREQQCRPWKNRAAILRLLCVLCVSHRLGLNISEAGYVWCQKKKLYYCWQRLTALSFVPDLKKPTIAGQTALRIVTPWQKGTNMTYTKGYFGLPEVKESLSYCDDGGTAVVVGRIWRGFLLRSPQPHPLCIGIKK